MSQSSQYSTLAVSEPRRFDYWKEVVCRHCLAADSKTLSQSNFEGALKVHDMGALDICTLSSPLHHWERSAQHLRSGPAEDLWLGFTRIGRGELEQGGRKATLAAGNLFLYDASQTFRFSLGGTENHLIRIPRQLLSERLPGVADYTAMVLDDRRPGVIRYARCCARRRAHRQSCRMGESLVGIPVRCSTFWSSAWNFRT